MSEEIQWYQEYLSRMHSGKPPIDSHHGSRLQDSYDTTWDMRAQTQTFKVTDIRIDE